MSQNRDIGAPLLESIDWRDDEAPAIDGLSVSEIKHMLAGGDVTAQCAVCGATEIVEPDASEYGCPSCGQHAGLTSPLVKLGLI